MMMFWRRVVRLVKQKVNALLQRVEDPVETLDLLDAEYVNDMRKMRRNIAGVLCAEKRMQLELLRLREQERDYGRLATQALDQGDDVVSRRFADRAGRARKHVIELQCGYASVAAQRKELEALEEEMCSRLDAIRVRRHATRAESMASRALIAACELMLPLSSEAFAREESLDHAHEALLRLRSRSQALSQLNHGT